MLAVIRRGYAEFEERAGQVKAPRGAKAGLVLAAIRQQLGDFQLSEIERACPGVGREWIRSLLTDLKASGEVSCQGKGPAARWRYLGNKGINSKEGRNECNNRFQPPIWYYPFNSVMN